MRSSPTFLKGLTRPEAAIVERDRAAAIHRAIAESAATDVVLIAGKGHEDYQIVGAERRLVQRPRAGAAGAWEAVMIAWKPSEIARYSQGRVVGADREFTSVSTDTRTIKPGALFVALTGPSFDGHDFVATAAQNGAAAALVSKELPVDVPQIIVADPLAALSTFARSGAVSSIFP